MERFLVWALLVSVVSGCLVRAPTSYELDKRAGNGIPPAAPAYEHPKRNQRRGVRFEEPLRATSGIAPAPLMPARTAPVIRRVWVSDQTLPDGSWLQGTWWFMEVEPSRWLYEVDPGSAPFAEPALAPQPAPEPSSERRSGLERELGDLRSVPEPALTSERQLKQMRRRMEPEPRWFGPFQVKD